MPGFADELRECLAQVVGAAPPATGDDDPLLVCRQWLASRNLGLVPIDAPASFSWPGPWLARVREVDGAEHAAVMFGAPSGPLHDPGRAFGRGAAIVEGWVVAALDLQLGTDAPYAGDAGQGTVEGLFVAAAREEPLRRLDSAAAVAGRGLDGDRYADGAGTFSGRGTGYQLTLVEAEALADVDGGLEWHDARRNVVTRGIRLNALVGRRFRIGDVECVARRLSEPCAHLEHLTRPGVLRALVHRGGLRADVVTGGTIRVGDTIEAVE